MSEICYNAFEAVYTVLGKGVLRVAEINTAAVQLLEQAKIILDTREKVLKPAAENFNMFSILNMETNEVDTHSKMLFELLSPSGSHGKG